MMGRSGRALAGKESTETVSSMKRTRRVAREKERTDFHEEGRMKGSLPSSLREDNLHDVLVGESVSLDE